jgi:hypothetical protein
MKNALLLFLFIPFFSFAQQDEAPVKKNEFGINAFSLKRVQLSYNLESRRNGLYAEPHVLPGIYYKRHFGKNGKNAWRSSFEFTRRATTSNGQGGPWYFPKGSTLVRKNAGISLGYERAFGNKKWQPFAFADLVFNYENINGTTILPGYGGPDIVHHYIFEDFEYSIAAGAGLRYKVNPGIHFTYETSAQHYRSVSQDVLNAGEKNWGTGYHINPVNKLGVAILF